MGWERCLSTSTPLFRTGSSNRWGATHQDYGTSEYEAARENESESEWENCRGIGFSFGYNQVEGPEQSLTGQQLARHLTDVVSRGGHFLLNVGPRADGTIPEIQRQALTDLGKWMATAKQYLVGARPLQDGPGASGDDSWIRWLDRGTEVVAFVDSLDDGTEAALKLDAGGFDVARASVEGPGGTVEAAADGLKVTLSPDRPGPAIVRIPRT